MDDRRVAGLAAVVTLLVGVGRTAPDIVRSRLVGEPAAVAGILPPIGTTGQTITVYLGALQAVGPLVTWTLALGLGYYLARRRDAADDLRSLAVDLATGSVTAVVVVTFAALAAQLLSGSLDGPGVLIVMISLVISLVATVLSSAVPVVVGGVTAAALTAQAHERETRSSSGGAATDSDGDVPPERVRDHAVEEAD